MSVGQFIEAFSDGIPYVVKNGEGLVVKSFKTEWEIAKAIIDWDNKNLVIVV